MPHAALNLPHRSLLALAGILLLALALEGCGTEPSKVLAKVGKRVITADEFIEVARDNHAQYPGPADSAKARLLDDMVQRALVLHDAERLGLYREPSVADSREQLMKEELEKEIHRRMVATDVAVSDAEIQRLHAWRDSMARVRVILCQSRAAVDAARGELARGARFGEIADHYGSGMIPSGGDLGFVLAGSVPPLDRWLREAPIGTVVGPVEVPEEGWLLVEVLERKPHAQPPLEQARAQLREMLRGRKVRAQRLMVQRSLRQAYDLRPEPGGAQAAFAYFNQSAGTIGDNPPPTAEQSGAVLARFDAGGKTHVYTLGDALTDLTDYERDRPNSAMTPALARWIDAQALRRIALIEARRRHLDEEPDVVRRVDGKVDNLALDLYYQVEVANGVEGSPEDLREAWERNAASYQRLDRVDLLVATLPDSESAARVAKHAGHAPTLREAIEMAAPGAPVSELTVRYPNAPAPWAEVETRFKEMAPHECLDPVAAQNGWLLIQLSAKQQETEPLEQLPPQMVQSLRRQADEIARARVLMRKTDALRNELRPEVHIDRLRAIPWPIPRGRS